MNIIISEKAIAGKRIATILSNNNFKTTNEGGVNCFSFTKNKIDYLIIPLRGHINSVDFAGDSGYWNIFGLDVLADKEMNYLPVEKKIISQLKKKRVDLKEIVIATDADREGEAIGVEAYNYLIEKNKDTKLHRAYFSALTPAEVNKAFEKLKKLDFNFAYSVFARQEIDLLWGAILTRYLSVVANRKGKNFLSAGRVQTPLLNFIVERELERQKFKSEPYNVIKIIFEKDKLKFEGIFNENKIFDLEKAKKVFEEINSATQGIVKSVTKKEKTIPKIAPFNTTSFLRAASNIGLNTTQAISTAEKLYQEGLISYPRTDNTVYPKSLDFKGILNTLSVDKDYKPIVNQILKKPIKPSRGKKETTDHPPIHPVSYSANLSSIEQKIYDLIVRRFLATLSIDAKTENMSVKIDVNNHIFTTTGQVILEPGWKKIYHYSKLNEVVLPNLKVKDIIDIKDKIIEDKETTPPSRYTEGGLIKLMEEENLGTKSTRPAIIKKLRDRGYIEGAKQISATNIAIAVCKVLQKHCELITQPKLTALTETEMDEVAAGKKEKVEVVNSSRKTLKTIIEILKKERQDISQELRAAVKVDSVIGKCTVCGKDLLIRISRNNKQFIGCSGYPKCTNTFPLPQGKKVLSTDKICEYCNNPIVKILNGRKTFEMCINHKCKSKEEYFEKVEQAKKAKEEKENAKTNSEKK